MTIAIQWIGAAMAIGGMTAVAAALPVYIRLKPRKRIRRERLLRLQTVAAGISLAGLAIVIASGFAP